jgi:hypothetical protein
VSWKIVLSTLALLFVAACRHKGPAREHISLGDSDHALRVAFNADVGKVRLVVLVAPT